MCLAVPGRIVRWLERDEVLARAVVEFGGVCRPVAMACVPDAVEGDYVLVHAGVAITRLDAAEAEKTLEEYRRLQELEEAPWEAP